MKQFLVTVVCAGAGFWLGAHRLVPLWLIVVLAVLGSVRKPKKYDFL